MDDVKDGMLLSSEEDALARQRSAVDQDDLEPKNDGFDGFRIGRAHAPAPVPLTPEELTPAERTLFRIALKAYDAQVAEAAAHRTTIMQSILESHDIPLDTKVVFEQRGRDIVILPVEEG